MESVDVAVLGGTPAGIASAIAAARMGCTVALIDSHAHLGGMSASGLSKSDVEKHEYIGGLFTEFIGRVRAHYLHRYGEDSETYARCHEGYYFEPSVAELIFNEMVRECAGLKVLLSHRLQGVEVGGHAVRALVLENPAGEKSHLQARVFIDATYVGDLYAAAGAPFRLGREGRDEYGESLAGHIYYDFEEGQILPASTGVGDDRLTAYTYRLTLCTNPENSVVRHDPPDGYDRNRYTAYFEDLEAGRLSAPKVFKPGRGYYPEHFDTLVRALSVTEIPNAKVDVNINPRPLAFPFPEENAGYVEANWEKRASIETRHRNLALGLLWFLQQDEEIPAKHREMANQYHLPRDEYTDNGHFPWQLYVREARRLKGRYTLTQHHVASASEGQIASRLDDVIAMGEFPIDSFPTRKKQPGDSIVLEGYLGMLGHLTRPYQIPYRAMLPEGFENIIVPCALSATHVAFSSIRMEPTWMALGHAAGVAAYLSVNQACPASDIAITRLQELLTAQGQVLGQPN